MIDKFKNVTGYDIGSFFSKYADFVDNYYQNLVDFYSGKTDLDRITIVKLEELNKSNNKVAELFNRYVNNLSDTAEYWDLLERYENVRLKIGTINATKKWTRSGIDLRTGNNVRLDFVQDQGETLEGVASRVGFLDRDNSWTDIAINNNLNEEDYTMKGGAKMSVSLENNISFYIESVVDDLTGENIYGKDILKKITYESDDLKVLPPKETVVQACNILLELKKGDVPQFPLDGIDKSMFIGRNLNSVSYPSIFRQVINTFRRDDTFKEVSITDVVQDDDVTLITLNIRTKLDEIIENSIKV